ncbi:MAG: hypothetical protein ACC645_13225, partial [Pirellulales bacterium]
DAEILRDVYDYSVTLPSQINTFLANYDRVNRVLTVNGDPGGVEDNISLKLVGTDVWVNVNEVVASFPLESLSVTNVLARDDDDTLIIDFTNGNPIPDGGIIYDGGSDSGDHYVLEPDGLAHGECRRR